jgi:F420-non-reducing hydrogenase small subunit
MQLASCWGCHQSLLNAHLGLLDVLPALDIVYWPAVVDFKRASLKARAPGEIVVGFIEGHVRTHEDVENIKLMREKCKILISYGTCACYGSVAGLANLYPLEDLTKRKFFDQPTIDDSKKLPKENVPPFEEVVLPVDKVVPVDAHLPGCPPKTENIVAAVTYLLNALPLLLTDPPANAACANCTIKGKGCLLDNGVLCFGGICAGPGAKFTPTAAKPLLGDYGPSKGISKAEADKLLALLIKKEFNEDEVKKINEFLLLYSRLPNFGFMDLTMDFIARLGTSPDAFPIKAGEGGQKQYEVKLAADRCSTSSRKVPTSITRSAVFATHASASVSKNPWRTSSGITRVCLTQIVAC